MYSIKEYDELNPGDATVDRNRGGDNGKSKFDRVCTCDGMSSSDMMMTVAIDNDKHNKSVHGGIRIKATKDSEVDILTGANLKKAAANSPAWLESSFVHLVTPRQTLRSTKPYDEGLYHHPSSGTPLSPSQGQHPSEHGFIERHELMLQLLQAASADIDDGDSRNDKKENVDDDDGDDFPELCFDCIDRVAAAVDAETQRLYAEVDAYRETVQSSQREWKMLRRTTNCVTSVGIGANLASTHAASEIQTNRENENYISNTTIEEAYQEEIAILEREIEMRNDELLNYKQIYKEQTKISEELSALEEDLQRKENSLELQSEAFDNRRQVLTKTLSEVQTEVDKLTCVSLPQILFDLQVDQARGLHYPLINQLRLAFRPKGDVPAQEIQVAWSQATQLLLILGTLLEYPGKDWKLVPLADCAKLIYRKEVFNLVPGDCRSLMAWNALLDQVVKHALSLVRGGGGSSSRESGDSEAPNKPVPPPYSSSPTMIGNTELARLDRTDHFGWSQVIHRMASNLLWLSNRAGNLAATQGSSLVHCVV